VTRAPRPCAGWGSKAVRAAPNLPDDRHGWLACRGEYPEAVLDSWPDLEAVRNGQALAAPHLGLGASNSNRLRAPVALRNRWRARQTIDEREPLDLVFHVQGPH
jgi:hypothetical protein